MLEDAKLLLGELLDRGVTGRLIHQFNQLPGDFTSAPIFSLRHADSSKSFSTARDCSI